MVQAEAQKHLEATAYLLGVEADGLLKALTTRTRQTVDGAFRRQRLHAARRGRRPLSIEGPSAGQPQCRRDQPKRWSCQSAE